MNILVIGGSGVLGKKITCELLRLWNEEAKIWIGDYQEKRGKEVASSLGTSTTWIYTDVKDKKSLETAIKGMDIVVIAVKQEKPLIQEVCQEHNVASLDVSPYHSFTNQMETLKTSKCANVVMAGFFPGLSGLAVKQAIEGLERVEYVEVALLQHTNAVAGVTGTLDMLDIVSTTVTRKKKGHVITEKGFRHKRSFPFENKGNNRAVRLIHHDEGASLTKELPIKHIRYWTGWNQAFFNSKVSFLQRTGMISYLKKMKHKKWLQGAVSHRPTKKEDAHLTIEVIGYMGTTRCRKLLLVSVPSHYETTAMTTAALTKIIKEKKIEGTVHPFQFTTLEEVRSVMESTEIQLQTFLHPTKKQKKPVNKTSHS